MKLLYCSDLHGNLDHYTRLVGVARDRRPDLIVLGGDMLPDDSALLPERLGHGQPEFVRRQYRQWLLTLRDVCGSRPILFVFGNHDWGSSVPAVKELADDGLLTVLEPTHAIEVGGLSFVGYPCTPPTPWYVKDFERLDQRGDRLPLLGGARWDPRFGKAGSHGSKVLFELAPTIADDLAVLKAPDGPWVFVAHAPPFESKLDRTHGGEPWGSRSIRGVIEKLQPVLSLHGHVHESPAVTGEFRETLGRTVAINAGQTSRKLLYAVIEVDVSARKVARIDHGQQV
jgi:Icc-related predicted phosphoesterase